MKKITVALAGNPNSGKTTIFNNLTGTRQHVGNYPGVTVEKKEGVCRYQEYEIKIVDLPGTYSLTAYSTEEIIARNFIIEEKPDVIVDILDASNLQRNLYLTTQFMELGVPLVLALNMADVAKARGIKFDLEKLSHFFGAPVIPTVGNRGKGMDELLEAIIAVATGKFKKKHMPINYGKELENEINNIEKIISEKKKNECRKYGARWVAIKLLENDEEVRRLFNSQEVLSEVDERARRLEKLFGDPPEIILADRRYGFISGACQEAVRSTVESRYTMSDRIDSIVTNRVLGIPIFLGLMYLVFQLTFTLGDPPMGWIENLFGWLSEIVASWWPAGSESALKSLLIDGIIGGVGGVVVFLPNILLLFLAIAVLEDSGYMARAAFIMDRVMHKIGLHGKSFIPMLIGFGCSIPAIMATRTLENEKDRLTTILVTPLMSCGARLPIYALIIPAFFPTKLYGPMLWTIYVVGILMAIIMAKVIRSTLFKGASTPFVMELPPYRLPTLRGILIHVWERSWLYLKKAGTIILAISIVLWAATNYPKKSVYEHDYGKMLSSIETEYLNRVGSLGEKLGVTLDPQVMAAILEGDKDALGEISTRKNLLDEIVRMESLIQEAKKQFMTTIEVQGIEEGTAEYRSLQDQLANTLEKIKGNNPKVYDAVIAYLEEIKPQYEERLMEIENQKKAEELAYSLAGRIGHLLEPILRPMGFDWRIGTALIGAFAAKEVFVAQMGIVYSVGEADEESETLRKRLQASYNPLIGFCIMLFCLISAPCMATIAITRRETNSWKWAMVQLVGLTVLAWIITASVYQIGSILEIGFK